MKNAVDSFHAAKSLTGARSGAVDQMEDDGVEGTLLVREICAVQYDCNHANEGHNTAYLFPAFKDGKKAWLLRKVWSSSEGYSCDGQTDELVLEFSDGLKRYAEHALFFGDE